MTKKKEGSGLQSSAGLMRYYDAEETAISITPKAVIIFSVVVGVAVLILNASFGYWPLR